MPVFTKIITFDETKQRWSFVYIILLVCICVNTLNNLMENSSYGLKKSWLAVSNFIILIMISVVVIYQKIGEIQISKRALVKIKIGRASCRERV